MRHVGLLVISVLWALVTSGGSATLSGGGIDVVFDERAGTIDCRLDGALVLSGASVRVTGERGALDTTKARLPSVDRSASPDGVQHIVVTYVEGFSLSVELVPTIRRVRLRVDGTGNWSQASLQGAHLRMGPEPIVGFAIDDQPLDRRVLTTTLGPAEVPDARTIFDRERDVALSLAATTGTWGFSHRPGADPGAWYLRADAPVGVDLLSLRFRPHYYRDELGIAYYTPIRKGSYFETAPCVAMTWYGLPGWDGRPAQLKERLYPEIEWVARNLGPYSDSIVFQLDDNYAKQDDAYMRAISDEIRRHGLIPGIWFTPFVVAPQSVHADHPDWFLHDSAGNPIQTFGGISYDGFTLNTANAAAVDAWFRPWWRKVSETWDFGFFKIDGQPNVIDVYRTAKEGVSVDAYRHGLDVGREVVGDAKFINGCWGTPIEAIGKLNGSRTGGDTGNQPHAIDVVIRYNYLNNVCWWSDPDAAANLWNQPVERARLNTQARTLTGQQFLTDDTWTKVPPEIAYVWQRGIPNADIKPSNLYRLDTSGDYDVFDLKVGRGGRQWDVVGLFNYSAAPVTKTLTLDRLGLGVGKFHVYEAWESRYLGCCTTSEEIRVPLQAYEGKLLTVHRKTDGPVVLGTSRHITQGGLDLESVTTERTRDGWLVRGFSSHLVRRDRYTIALYVGAHDVEATADVGPATTRIDGELALVDINPLRSGDAKWTIRLRERKQPYLAVRSAELDLGTVEPGRTAEGEITVLNLGGGAVEWQAKWTRTEWLELEDWFGEIGGNSEAGLKVHVDATGLPWGTEFGADVVITGTGALRRLPSRVTVRFRTAEPPNLAHDAKATASSAWPGDYGPELANDGRAGTRWNSQPGDRDGAWIALEWPKSLTVDRVVVNEVMDWGHRIQQWRLEYRVGDTWRELSGGALMGPDHVVDFIPVTTGALRLVIERSTDTPTISEIRVCRRSSATAGWP